MNAEPLMNIVYDVTGALAHWIRPYVGQIAVAIVATLLVIYGEDINAAIKKRLQKNHFLIRVLIFILVCAFGYGALSVLLTKLLTLFLDRLDSFQFVIVLTLFFFVMGILAEHKKHI